jgi:uncharacterized ubiquitin-like protein YukD
MNNYNNNNYNIYTSNKKIKKMLESRKIELFKIEAKIIKISNQKKNKR